MGRTTILGVETGANAAQNLWTDELMTMNRRRKKKKNQRENYMLSI